MMEKTKEEFIDEHFGKRPTWIEDLMQAYANQEKRKEAMAFQRWCNKNADKMRDLFTEDLYNAYLQSIT